MNQLRSFSTSFIGVIVSLAAITGCSQNKSPVVSNVETSAIAPATDAALKMAVLKETAAEQSALPGPTLDMTAPSGAPQVSAKVTFQKSSLFNRIFLYGSDLQYSTIHDAGLSLFQQSSALGHIPCFFREVGDHLQLVADQRSQYESDVDHPERLIENLKIVSEDSSSLTVEFREASPVMSTVVAGPKAPPVRTSWVRSAQFVPQGEYMMFETSIEMADGSIAEFMETFFPRETLVPKEVKPLLADPELEPLAKRFRFLDDGDIFLDIPGKGRVKTKIATRFASNEATSVINWYVTPNIPPEFLPEIKNGIEGWNRYSQAMWGKDMIHFNGILPAGVKLGDPRYNVVNWDSVAKAGAAYESQATDPYTGIQSHSLIYLPKAWINIGTDYWKGGGPSADPAKAKADQDADKRVDALRDAFKQGTFLDQPLQVRCMRDAKETITMEARTAPDDFAKGLLKGTLFHEVGHALGLAHNFKGSLSYDPNDPKSMFSTSIMDYNQYNLEKAAFDGLDSSNGPLLEYDRQILSALYNNSKDIKAGDATLPACEDHEADDDSGGVDPLCIRYDAGHDPTQQLVSTIALLKDESAKLGQTVSLPTAIKSLIAEFGDPSTVKTEAAAKAGILAAKKALTGIVGFYYVDGAQSLSYMARANIRSLRTFEKSILPATYQEMAMRSREANGIMYVATTEEFEPATKAAVEAFKAALQAWVASTPFISAQASADQVTQATALLKDIVALPGPLEKLATSKLREKTLVDLKASEKAPYFFLKDEKDDKNTIDLEEDIAMVLARTVIAPLADGSARPLAERVAAALALKTFAVTVAGSSVVAQASKALQAEAGKARNNEDRSNVLTVFKALNLASQ